MEMAEKKVRDVGGPQAGFQEAVVGAKAMVKKNFVLADFDQITGAHSFERGCGRSGSQEGNLHGAQHIKGTGAKKDGRVGFWRLRVAGELARHIPIKYGRQARRIPTKYGEQARRLHEEKTNSHRQKKNPDPVKDRGSFEKRWQ